jgi:hypothetical protein
VVLIFVFFFFCASSIIHQSVVYKNEFLFFVCWCLCRKLKMTTK